jgi:uncharacterized protein YndB with AHSA1/START domain
MASVKRSGWVFALALAAPIAMAEVTGAGASGFEVREKVHIAATPDTVYATVLAPKRWWDPKHTYSGDANRLTLEAKAGGCWCESMPGGGSVEHLEVTYLAPGKAVRFRGALGPLQAMGVAGSLTITLAAGDGGTDLTLTYAVGGYARDGFEEISKGVDGVLAAQVARLKKAVETGSVQHE